MQKKLSISLLIIVACVILLISALVSPVQAQSSTLTPTVTPTWIPLQAASPTLSATPTSSVTKFINPNVVTFSQIQGEEKSSDIILKGPFDANGLTFAIPANWALRDGAQLDLLFGVSFNSVTDLQENSNVTVVGGGTLTVFLNDRLISTLPLREVGEVEQKITIPLSAFEAVRKNKINVLWFKLESSESCRFFGQNTAVIIHSSSFLTLPHDDIQPSTNLINFPRPIIQNSFFPDSALVILPNQPSSAELQAALTVAAGLGKLSSNELVLNLATISDFNTNAALADNQLIFIGKAASLSALSGLGLPVPVVNGEFPLSADGPDDGVLEMIVSPWSKSHVLLVVSANTDQGIIRAAQAVSTGVIRPNRRNDFALIQKVNNLTPISNSLPMDRTLADFGYQGRTFENRGYNTEQYIFNVPSGMSVNPDAYFEIVYGHSSLMDYNSSQIVLLLNGQPIGSVRMDDATASLPTNHAKIMIPPAAMRPGDNRLDIVVNMVPIIECSPPDSRGLWVNIWPQSLLHLPMIAVSSIPTVPQNLATYPAPFNYDPALASTAFVLGHKDLESWQNAMQIASYLGYQTSGSIIELSAFYGDEIPVVERSKYNLVVIGSLGQMPIVKEMNNNLPAPFLDGSEVAGNGNFQVTYRIPSDSPMGYIETMQSPWNSNNVVLAILGNTTEGVNWAAKALIDPILRSDLSGNFAIVNDSQILTTNTFYSVVSPETISATVAPNVAGAPVGVSAPQTQALETPPMWVLPTIAVSSGLIILTIVIAILRRRWLHHIRRKASSTKQHIEGSDKESKT